MASYVVKLGLAAVVFLVAGIFAMFLFSGIWARVGIGTAIVIVCGGLLLWAWNFDRKEKAERAGLEDLPRV